MPPEWAHHPPDADLDNLIWLGRARDFMDVYGFPQEVLEAVVRNPERSEIDTSSAERDYPVMRHRKGDITVLVGYRFPNRPAVVYVVLHTPNEDQHTRRGSVHGSGGGSGSTLPRSDRQLRAALVRMGCTLEHSNRSGGSHTAVYYDGVRVGTLVGTPGDHRELANKYKSIARRVAAMRAPQQ